MNFSIDGASWLGGGFVLILIFAASVIAMMRFNAVDRPEDEQNFAEPREAHEREERMVHENDVEL